MHLVMLGRYPRDIARLQLDFVHDHPWATGVDEGVVEEGVDGSVEDLREGW